MGARGFDYLVNLRYFAILYKVFCHALVVPRKVLSAFLETSKLLYSCIFQFVVSLTIPTYSRSYSIVGHIVVCLYYNFL